MNEAQKKAAKAAGARRYREAHREQARTAAAAWIAAHPDRARATTAAWKAANPERVRAHKAAWRERRRSPKESAGLP